MLEQRLGRSLVEPPPQPTLSAPTVAAEAGEAVAAVPQMPEDGGEPPNWPDESAESAFIAEARERGEAVRPVAPAAKEVDDGGAPKSLPALEELVNRIPAEVREALDDLFRARFVTVKRVPKKALKTDG